MKCAGDQCMYANSLAWSTYVQFPCTHVHLHILGYQFLSVNSISYWQVNAHEAQINAHLLIDQPSLCSVKWAICGKSLKSPGRWTPLSVAQRSSPVLVDKPWSLVWPSCWGVLYRLLGYAILSTTAGNSSGILEKRKLVYTLQIISVKIGGYVKYRKWMGPSCGLWSVMYTIKYTACLLLLHLKLSLMWPQWRPCLIIVTYHHIIIGTIIHTFMTSNT